MTPTRGQLHEIADVLCEDVCKESTVIPSLQEQEQAEILALLQQELVESCPQGKNNEVSLANFFEEETVLDG